MPYVYFARTIFLNTAAALIVGIISCTSFRTDFYLNLAPNGLSDLLLPLVLFVIFKCMYQRCMAWAVRSIQIILPIQSFLRLTIFIAMVLLTLWIPHTMPGIAQYIHRRRTSLSDLKNYKYKFMQPFLTIFIWFLFWISSFRGVGYHNKDYGLSGYFRGRRDVGITQCWIRSTLHRSWI